MPAPGLKKISIAEIARRIGVVDLRLTDGKLSGLMYTAKNKSGYGPRIFIAWDKKQLLHDAGIDEYGRSIYGADD
jgi:hypothetical protein